MRKFLVELLGVAVTVVELVALVAIRHRVIRLQRSVILAEVYAQQIRQRSDRNAPN